MDTRENTSDLCRLSNVYDKVKKGTERKANIQSSSTIVSFRSSNTVKIQNKDLIDVGVTVL